MVQDIYYFLVIMNDGSVYTINYSLNESGSDNNNFLINCILVTIQFGAFFIISSY